MGLETKKEFVANHTTEVPWVICDDIKTVEKHIKKLGFPVFKITDVERVNPRTKKIHFYAPPDSLPQKQKPEAFFYFFISAFLRNCPV